MTGGKCGSKEAYILKRNYLVEGFPERLKQAIEDSGLSHVDILRRTGISKSTFYCYLDGSVSPQGLHIARLATCLHVSSDFLLGISE